MSEVIFNKTFLLNPPIKEEDFNADTVSKAKTWVRCGNMFKCGNCGKIPTYVDIREWKHCPHCEVLKTFYEGPNGDLIYMGSDAMRERIGETYSITINEENEDD